MAFTDIEGSTKLLQRVGEGWAEILGAHHDVIRAAIAAHDGYEVDTAGDGFFVTFAKASDAVAFAVDAQRGLARHPVTREAGVRVRMGLHSGEVEVSGGDYLGLAVHHAARIGGAGHGGQVLVSQATRELAGDAAHVGFADLGEFELKDLARPVRLFQLTHPDLGRVFPTVHALNARDNNLPVMRTSLVGRAHLVTGLRKHLEQPGMLTLTGPGGCGKTRLAVEVGTRRADGSAGEVAREALDLFPGGAWFVDLRSATDDPHVEELLAAALGVGEGGERFDAIVTRVAREPTLVVLDNCEHLVDACADVAERLLDRCPDVRLIATTRDLLGVEGEVARRVPSLGADAAAQLFAERAGRVQPAFTLDQQTAEVVSRICTRLDGIPLAIELAAARLRHMSAEALEARLDDMFRVLVGSDRRALQRHQTLEAVVDWSYKLLTDEERSVFRRLAVFAGGFDLDAVAAVCDNPTAPDLVFRLVDRSLVERGEGDRYSLLETIRAFAQSRLADAGEADDARRRHLAHFAAFAARLGPRVRGTDFWAAIDDAEAEVDNHRAALEWAVRSGDVDSALRLSADLSPFFGFTGRGAVVDSLVGEALAAGEAAQAPALVRARAYAGAAMAGGSPGYNASIVHAPTAIALYESLDASERDDLYGWALAMHATQAAFLGDAGAVTERATRALRVAQDGGWSQPAAGAEASAAFGHMRDGDIDRARAEMAKAVARMRADPGGLLEASTLFWSGILAIHARDWAPARRFYEEAIPFARRVSYKLWLQWMLDHVAHACIRLNDLPAARAYCEEGLTTSRESGLVGFGNYGSILSNLGEIETRNNNLDQAALHQEESVALARGREYDTPERRRHGLASVVFPLADLRVRLGQRHEAATLLREAVELVDGLEPIELESLGIRKPPISGVLGAVARLLESDGRAAEAVELLAAADAWRQQQNEPRTADAQQELDNRLAQLRAALGAAFDTAWARGSALTAPLERAAALLS